MENLRRMLLLAVVLLPTGCEALSSSRFIISQSPNIAALHHHRSQNPIIDEQLVGPSQILSNFMVNNSNRRRQVLQLLVSLPASMFSISSPVDASTNLLRSNFFSLSDMDSKKKSVKDGDETTPVKVPEIKRQDLSGGFLLGKGLEIESWMLKLLPIKNNVFQILLQDISSVSILRENKISESMWEILSNKLATTILFLDNQRFNLQPIFNLEDTTELDIAKAERGEKLLESLRTRLVELNTSLIKQNITSTLLDQQMALRALAEVGEVLVEEYPFNVPDKGKFSYLPRLLGRAKVTFTISRPIVEKGSQDRSSTNKPWLGRLESIATSSPFASNEEILGNITILADGFIAPITAGNFIDLSTRGFYNDLEVNYLRKRFGINPSLTLPDSTNLVAYDIADTIDKIKALEDGISISTDKDEAILTTDIPVFGSFSEGFYDPITAKPRRIPFEVVQYDSSNGKTKLSYSSAAVDTTDKNLFSQVSSDKGKRRILPSLFNKKDYLQGVLGGLQKSNVLNFNIPGLVAMNHPDKNLNGGSSEFFILQAKERIDERSSLLNGSYAPFGYVLDGLDILESLQPGDKIHSTHVDEWGKLNLVKIRKLSLTEGMAHSLK